MKKNAWLLVANSSVAQIYKLENRHQLIELKKFEHPESRLRNIDLVSDKPGRDFESMGNTRHAMEPKTLPKKHEFEKFAQELANYLNQAFNQHEFELLYLIANPPVLGLLRQSLNSNTLKSIEAEVNKDLTHLKESEILEHLPFY